MSRVPWSVCVERLPIVVGFRGMLFFRSFHEGQETLETFLCLARNYMPARDFP